MLGALAKTAALSVAATAVSSAASAALNSHIELVKYAGNFSLPAILPSPEMLLDAYLRANNQRDKFLIGIDLQSHGISMLSGSWQRVLKYSKAAPGVLYAVLSSVYADYTGDPTWMQFSEDIRSFSRVDWDTWRMISRHVWMPYSIIEITDLYARGLIDNKEYAQGLSYNWVVPNHPFQQALYHSRLHVPGVSDLIRFMVRDAFREDIVAKYGYDEEYPALIDSWLKCQGMGYKLNEHPCGGNMPAGMTWGKVYWRAHWYLPSPTQAQEMLVLLRPNRAQRFAEDIERLFPGVGQAIGDITVTPREAIDLMKIADYPPFWRSRLLALAYKPMTQRFLQQAITEDVPDPVPLEERVMDLGFLPTEAEVIAKMLRIRAAFARASRGEAISPQEAIKLYVNHDIDDRQLRDILNSFEFSQERLQSALNRANLLRRTTGLRSLASRGEALSIREAVQMYANGVLTLNQLQEVARTYGLPAHRVQAVVTRGNVLRTYKHLKRLETIVHRGMLTRQLNADQARQALVNAGMDAGYAQQLVNMWTMHRDVTRRRETAEGIVQDAQLGVIPWNVAINELVNMGYMPGHAWRIAFRGYAKLYDRYLRQIVAAYKALIRETERELSRQRKRMQEIRRIMREEKIDREKAEKEYERRLLEAQRIAEERLEGWERQAKEMQGQEPEMPEE